MIRRDVHAVYAPQVTQREFLRGRACALVAQVRQVPRPVQTLATHSRFRNGGRRVRHHDGRLFRYHLTRTRCGRVRRAPPHRSRPKPGSTSGHGARHPCRGHRAHGSCAPQKCGTVEVEGRKDWKHWKEGGLCKEVTKDLTDVNVFSSNLVVYHRIA